MPSGSERRLLRRLGLVHICRVVAVFLFELLNSAFGIQHFLFARIKRMAVGADINL